MPDKLIPIARIGAAHGIKGEVRVKPYGDPALLPGYAVLQDQSGVVYRIASSRVQKNMLVMKFEHIMSREAAENLNGTELLVSRSQLPEPDDEEFYVSDLIGLKAIDVDGNPLGAVKNVHNHGAGDIIEVTAAGGGETYLLPFTREVVPTVDLQSGTVTLVPPTETSDQEEPS